MGMNSVTSCSFYIGISQLFVIPRDVETLGDMGHYRSPLFLLFEQEAIKISRLSISHVGVGYSDPAISWLGGGVT